MRAFNFRPFVVFIAAVATFYFVYWVPFSLIPGSDAVPWLPFVGSLICSAAVARYLWTHLASVPEGFMACAAMGALVTGGIGFCAGFFGPMILAPSANQGPLLGLFITGPLGFVLGGVGGGIYWFARDRGKRMTRRS